MNDSPFSCLPDLPCDIAPYVPHRYGMCLLDTLLAVGEEHLHASVTPQRDDLFATHDGIPGWVGLEWLAQAIAAWAGIQAVAGGDKPKIGFLLGTRRYQCQAPFFSFDQPIRIEVELNFRADNGLGAFHGRLFDANNQPIANATLNVFQPETRQALDVIQQGSTL
ncbi:hotdog family protein [Vreelandella titanicae]|jgi:predicted hotdog family 3-hydroxylacyl-ACP dehydratase|uniref:ApeP family dehydratase n=1 Tax=Vreelandella titanicae TaxID=664683 RepID=UPI0015941C34|nr:hotdog family protein [Halomonas titanicae]NVE91604.1 hotdog family protein [Halomonas titanicae]|tara:strand:+ start:86 stop:580 length:495 start_codon:yes stop_codon:yes gene_type:complete